MHAITDTVDQNLKKGYPGPGNYNHNSINGAHKKSPAFSVGTSKRRPPGSNKEDRLKPGPGVYNQTNDLRRSAPRFGFGKEQRISPARNSHQITPGPGAYRELNIF